MGHQTNDARNALRAYARDLEATAHRRRSASSLDTSKQDDVPNQFRGSGAPHQLAMAAVVVCVVLLGGIGLVAAISSTDGSEPDLAGPVSVESSLLGNEPFAVKWISTADAVHAFSKNGLPRAATALDAARRAGVDSSPLVREAVNQLLDIIDVRVASADAVEQGDVTISLAIAELEAAIRPPGLDIERVPPGHGGTPPGLDKVWLEQVKEVEILRPTEEPALVPPGRDKSIASGNHRDVAPGQTKDKEKKENGKL